MIFANEDISILDDSGDIPEGYTGMYIEVFSSIENRLATGVYVFSNNLSEFTFNQIWVFYNREGVELQSGNLEVLSSDTDSYDVVFEDVDRNNVDLEFSGFVNYTSGEFSSKGVEKPTKIFGKRK